MQNTNIVIIVIFVPLISDPSPFFFFFLKFLDFYEGIWNDKQNGLVGVFFYIFLNVSLNTYNSALHIITSAFKGA